MVDEQPLTKADLQVFLAALQQETDTKLATQRADLLKEFDTRENKIHSSYAKQLKKAGVNTQALADDDEDAPLTHKPTKKELEMQANIEKLVRERDEEKATAKAATQKQAIIDQLIKSGFKNESVDTLHKLFRTDNLISEDEDGNLMLKVTPENSKAKVSLPLEDALKHYSKSNEGKLFIAPLGTQGSGAKTNNSSNSNNTDNSQNNKTPLGRERPKWAQIATVDWAAVSKDQGDGGSDGGAGMFAPPFER